MKSKTEGQKEHHPTPNRVLQRTQGTGADPQTPGLSTCIYACCFPATLMYGLTQISAKQITWPLI